MRLLRKIESNIKQNIIIIFISIICSIILINIFNKKTKEILLPMAEIQLKKTITNIINEATLELEIKNNLYTIIKDEKDEIKLINYHPSEVRKLITNITNNIRNKLNDIYEQNNKIENIIITEIPIGVIFNNTFLNTLGPKIKIKYLIIGSILSDIETEVKPYGINNAYIETRIRLKINAKISLPFASKEIIIENKIPITMNVIEGTIPNGYIANYK